MENAIRVALIKPGDVLLIGNVPIRFDTPEVMKMFYETFGIRVAVFEDDIEIGKAKLADLVEG